MHNLYRYNFYIQTIVDLIGITIAFFLAFRIKFKCGLDIVYSIDSRYFMLYLIFILLYLIWDFMAIGNESWREKNLTTDLKSVTKTVAWMFVSIIIFLFYSKTSVSFSRDFIAYFTGMLFIFMTVLRTIMRKQILPNIKKSGLSERVIAVGTYDQVMSYLNRSKNNQDSSTDNKVQNLDWRMNISGLIVIDRDMTGEYIDQIKVLSDEKNMMETFRTVPSDSVLLIADAMTDKLKECVDSLCRMGKIARVTIGMTQKLQDVHATIDFIGDAYTLNFEPIRKMSRRSAAVKRFIDIVFSLALMPLVGFFSIITIFFNLITPSSHGPKLSTRVRVGVNGRRFYQFRFRVFRIDAEDCLRKNKTPYTWWGWLMNHLYIDRLPILINIFYGDMSFVGNCYIIGTTKKNPVFSSVCPIG